MIAIAYMIPTNRSFGAGARSVHRRCIQSSARARFRKDSVTNVSQNLIRHPKIPNIGLKPSLECTPRRFATTNVDVRVESMGVFL